MEIITVTGKTASIILIIFLLAGCSSYRYDYNFKQLAKSDIDTVADITYAENNKALQQLLVKLYKRNPNALNHVPGMTIEKRRAMIFDRPGHLLFDELYGLEEIAAMSLAFSNEYNGDRVFALMTGLVGMLRRSYNYDSEFFLYDSLDAQRLYNSARNIEVVSWKLKNNKKPQGGPYIISSGLNGVIDNTSFERLYGKMIQAQDIMALIIADKHNRTINTVIKGTLSVFLPI